MFTKMRVVHIAVKNVKETIKDYQARFGLKATRSEELPELGIRNAILPLGEMVIELIEPLNPGEGPLAKFLDTRGEGVYMMGWEVEDLVKAVKDLQANGVRLVNAEPGAKGNIFIHPKSAHGLMIELLEKPR